MAEVEATTEMQTEQTSETTEQVEDQKPEVEQEQSEEIKPEETKQEETKQEETKQDEVKPEEQSEEEEEVEYVCPEEFDEREEMRKMFVGGLDKETTDEEFKELFAAFGEISDFIIIRKENSKSERLFGFITFAKCDDLEACLLARPHNYKDKELDVKRAVPKSTTDTTGHYRAKKLHVANIPPVFSVKTLKKYLKSRHPAKFGTIEDINFVKHKNADGSIDEKNKGFGFINVSTEDFADRISIAEGKFTLEGQNLRITKARPKNQGNNQMGGNRRGQWNNQGNFQNYGGGYNNYGPGYFNGPYGGGYGGGYGNGGYGGGGYGGYQHFGGQQGGGRGGRYKPY